MQAKKKIIKRIYISSTTTVPDMNYRKEASRWIKDNRLNCGSTKPVLFVGAGLSRRYLNAPNWRALLEEVLKFIKNPTEIEFIFKKLTKKI